MGCSVNCLWNYIGTSASADVDYLMAAVEAIFLYKNVINTSQNFVIGDDDEYSFANAVDVITHPCFTSTPSMGE